MFSANQIADLLINHISRINFLHVDANSHKLKVYQKLLGWALLEMSVASLVKGL